MVLEAIREKSANALATSGIVLDTTKSVKDLAKVTKGLVQLNVIDNPDLGKTSGAVVTYIDAAEITSSVKYFLGGEYKKDNNIKVAAQAFLAALRSLAFLKALDQLKILSLEIFSNLIGKMGVAGEWLNKNVSIDTFASIVYLPFAALSLVDNTQTITNENPVVAKADEKLAFWNKKGLTVDDVIIAKNVADEQPALTEKNIKALKVQAEFDKYVAKKVEKHTAKKEIASFKVNKSFVGSASTVFKVVAAVTSIVAAFALGGLVGALLLGVISVALVGNSLSLVKSAYEGYQAKYQANYVAQAKPVAAPAA